ncbi:hypothetical protein S40288_08068 [Stachybotrys chartarum IBT 40288]|nr:hypothetical protein S40288_08068 [Stachybotrys chartarum IBT 40288]
MDVQVKKAPRGKNDRIILQFVRRSSLPRLRHGANPYSSQDYDCFYAQVLEHKNPALRSQPLGVRQKNILATCNYNARRLGVRKLMLASEAKRLCPDLVLVNGEDLTPFRDVSKILFNFLRSHSWNNKVERLGFDEVFMDVTDIVDYNMFCLNRACLSDSFFYLSRDDPLVGFGCDLTSIAGCMEGSVPQGFDIENPLYLRLLLGSHLATHLRLKIEQEFGYTSTCGISTNKLLSKLVGARNKPRNQTTLVALTEQDVVGFIDRHALRKVPGIGSKSGLLLEAHIASKQQGPDSPSSDVMVTAGQVRLHPSIALGSLETLLGGPGSERGIGARVWGLLHGVDPAEVKEATDFPAQISIEDTYKGLEALASITSELRKLSCSLVRRMRIELLVNDPPGAATSQRWIARPRTLRLSIRSWPRPNGNQNSSRVSRSTALPSFVFDANVDVVQIAERLVAESLLPLFHRFEGNKDHQWNLQLINICVANMAPGATDDKAGVGRDISLMFKNQDETLRPFRITSTSDEETEAAQESPPPLFAEEPDADQSWGDTKIPTCPICSHAIPLFAQAAHARYHELED